MDNTTHTPAKRSIGFLLGMCTLMLGANLVWTAYNSLVLPTLVEGAVPTGKGLITGLVGFFGTLLAVIVNIVAGILSDHTTVRMGRRTPAILIGALLGLPLIGLPTLFLAASLRPVFLSMALAVTILSYVGMQFATNVANGAWWPLLVDVVPENQRGTASGIQGALTMVGATIAILVVTSLIQNGHMIAVLWLLGGIFALSGLVNIWVIRGKDKPAASSEKISLGRAIRDMFRVRTRVAVFFWMVVAIFLAFMGINSMLFFALYFFQVYFPSVNPEAAFRMMGGISLVLTLLSSVGAGMLSDKVGRRALILWALFICALTTLLMGLAGSYFFFLVMAGLRAIASGPLMATAPALASDLSPKDEAGHYMAYYNIATGLSGGIAGLVFGVILVNLTRTTFMALFIISAILFLAGGVVFAIKVTQKEIEQRTGKEINQAGPLGAEDWSNIPS